MSLCSIPACSPRTWMEKSLYFLWDRRAEIRREMQPANSKSAGVWMRKGV